jgi:hypothetical protein
MKLLLPLPVILKGGPGVYVLSLQLGPIQTKVP